MFKQIKGKLNNELFEATNKALYETPERYLTKLELQKVAEGKKTVEDFRGKVEKKLLKSGGYEEDFEKLERVEKEGRNVHSIIITVEWKRSKTWGSNPQAEALTTYTDGTQERFFGGKISGCGYDKESAATASVLNQIDALKREMYLRKEERVNEQNREVLGYGAGYGILPSFEGGVGFNCHRNIIGKLGYKAETISSSKNFTVYRFYK